MLARKNRWKNIETPFLSENRKYFQILAKTHLFLRFFNIQFLSLLFFFLISAIDFLQKKEFFSSRPKRAIFYDKYHRNFDFGPAVPQKISGTQLSTIQVLLSLSPQFGQKKICMQNRLDPPPHTHGPVGYRTGRRESSERGQVCASSVFP